MDEAKKKQLQQVAILVVLLVVLGLAVMMTVRRTQGGGGTTTATASRPAPSTSQTPTATAGARSVPVVMTGRTPGQLNPNMWRVYALTPPKNPFMQQESWYAATFTRLLPGYPWLKNNGYFEKPTEVLPNINMLFGKNVNFEKIELSRRFEDRARSLEGISSDGKMKTTITATEKTPPDIELVFDAQGNPIRKDIIEGNEVIGNLDDQGNVIGRAGSPAGPGSLRSLGPDDLMMQGQGESLAVHGVSIHSSGKASALLKVNGSTRIVGIGDALAPRYVVTKVSKTGVELKDTKSGEKRFVQLKAPAADEGGDMPLLSGLDM